MNCCKLMSSVRSKLKGAFIGWLCVSGEVKLCVQTCCAKVVCIYIYIYVKNNEISDQKISENLFKKCTRKS